MLSLFLRITFPGHEHLIVKGTLNYLAGNHKPNQQLHTITYPHVRLLGPDEFCWESRARLDFLYFKNRTKTKYLYKIQTHTQK